MKIEEAIEQAQTIVDDIRHKRDWNDGDLRTTSVLNLAVGIMQEANTTALVERLTVALELLNRPMYVYDTKIEDVDNAYTKKSPPCTCSKCLTKRHGIEMKDVESFLFPG